MKNILIDNKYSITEDGTVINNKTKQVKKAHIDRYGYLHMRLSDKNKKYFVHRLVALTYIENPDNKETVNHKDGNKLNNHISNLEWMTNKENLKHAYNNNLTKGIPVKCTKTGKTWNSISQAAKENNINPGHLYNMLHGKTTNGSGLKCVL